MFTIGFRSRWVFGLLCAVVLLATGAEARKDLRGEKTEKTPAKPVRMGLGEALGHKQETFRMTDSELQLGDDPYKKHLHVYTDEYEADTWTRDHLSANWKEHQTEALKRAGKSQIAPQWHPDRFHPHFKPHIHAKDRFISPPPPPLPADMWLEDGENPINPKAKHGLKKKKDLAMLYGVHYMDRKRKFKGDYFAKQIKNGDKSYRPTLEHMPAGEFWDR